MFPGDMRVGLDSWLKVAQDTASVHNHIPYTDMGLAMAMYAKLGLHKVALGLHKQRTCCASGRLKV